MKISHEKPPIYDALVESFGINWDQIMEVDFVRRQVGVERGQIVGYEYIKEIRN